jgi:hypothetical protein
MDRVLGSGANESLLYVHQTASSQQSEAYGYFLLHCLSPWGLTVPDEEEALNKYSLVELSEGMNCLRLRKLFHFIQDSNTKAC